MFDFIKENWPIIVSVSTVSAALFSHVKSIMEIKQIRMQLKLWTKQQALLEEQLKRMKLDASLEPSALTDKIAVPTEEQISKFSKRSFISFLIIVTVFGVSVFLHNKLKSTQHLFEIATALTDQSPESYKLLSHELASLSELREKTDSLEFRLGSTEREYARIIDKYIVAINSRNTLISENESLEFDVHRLENMIRQIKRESDALVDANEALTAASNDLINAIAAAKKRNEILKNIKDNLESNFNIPAPLFALSQRMNLTVPGFNFVSRKMGSFTPMDLETRTLSMKLDQLYRSRPDEKEYVALMKGTDIISIVRAHIEITRNFNKRLKSHLQSLSSEIESKSKMLTKIKSQNAATETEIKLLTKKKGGLGNEYDQSKEAFMELDEKYQEAIVEYEKLNREYTKEYNKQLKLLEEIGSLRLALEQK